MRNLLIEINPIYYRGERSNGYIRALDAIFRCGFLALEFLKIFYLLRQDDRESLFDFNDGWRAAID